MKKLWRRVKSETLRFWTETEGQDLVEYALIVAAIALAMIAVVQSVAAALNSIYQSIVVGLQSIGTPS
jgi:Flp pilus assembly pilin Flp